MSVLEDIVSDATRLEISFLLLTTPRHLAPRQFVLPPFVLGWLQRRFGTVRPTEESFKKTWRLLGICTCVLGALSLLHPASISRRILFVHTKDGGFNATSFFGSFFFASMFAALGLHVAIMTALYMSEQFAKAKSEWRLYGLLFLHGALAAVFAVAGIVFLLILAAYDPVVRTLAATWSDRYPSAPEVMTLCWLAVVKTMPFVVLVAPMLITVLFTTGWGLSAVSFKTFEKWIATLSSWNLWILRTFDVESKPISALGFVAGGVVATIYWTLASAAYL